jgi:hypothetical protein
MPAARGAVGQAKDNVNVKARLAVVAHSDVTDRAQNLALLTDLDLLVRLLVEVEPADGRLSKAPMAVNEAAVSPASFANFVSVANASSPESRMTTRVSDPASLAILVLFI